MSVATQKLNRERIYKVVQIREADEPTVQMPVVAYMDPRIKICLERAQLITESYRQTEGEPWILRRAKAVDHLLRKMTIYILDGDQIVGNYASTPDSLPTFPEFSYRWLEEGLDNGPYKDTLDEHGKKKLREINQYWETLSVESKLIESVPENLRSYARSSGWNGAFLMGCLYWPLAIMVPDYKGRVFPLGFQGLFEEVREYRGKLSATDPEFNEKRDFYDAVEITVTAVIAWIRRYAQLATSKAWMAEGNLRKDFEAVARVCSRIAEHPPETFHEALQTFYFCHLLSTQLLWSSVGLGQRFDQIFYPFYTKEREKGTITYERAVELFEFLWVKLDDLGQINSPAAGMVQVGGTKFQNIAIGGVDEHGDDATNELSFAAIEATMNLRTLQPALTLRYHKNIDPKLIDKATDCIASGMGMPSFFNDETVIETMLAGAKERMGEDWSPENEKAALEMARNWASIACVGGGTSTGQVVRGTLTTMITSGVLNFLKCLEYVMYQGVEPETGEQVGLKTPDPRSFTSYDEFLKAYLAQIRYQMEQVSTVYEIAEMIYEERTPRPFESLLMTTPIMYGRDGVHKGDMSVSQVYTQAPVNAGDSLAVIKKLVFDEKSVTMDALIGACAANWEGYEYLQKQCIKVPKFGNDDDYVDRVLYDMYRKAAATIESVKSCFGTPFTPEATLAAGYFFGGISTGATPDGRKKRETVSDAQLSPMRGRDTNGPTAVLKSCSKIKVADTWNQLFNQKLSPSFLKGKNRKLFADYLRTWHGFGNWHIQINCQDAGDLKDAQVHPERHGNLVVRVAGYSAHFTDLTCGIQDDIIARTEQQFPSTS